MKIAGRFNTYKCNWQQHGYAGAIINIYEKMSIFRLFSIWVNVSQGKNFGGFRSYIDCQKMKPKEFISWAKCAVDEYELYMREWERFHEGECNQADNGLRLRKLK